MQPSVVAAIGDLHAGSTLGLCPLDGVEVDDGGRYMPNASQRQLWAWWCEYWAWFDEIASREGAARVGIVNGEFCDNFHHRTVQVISTNAATHVEAAIQCMRVPLSYGVDQWYVTKGTEAHSGGGGALDEAVARAIGAAQDPDSTKHARYHWLVRISGVVFDVAHHPQAGGGRLPWTLSSVAGREAALLGAKYYSAPEADRPHVALRSHVHRFGDSGEDHPIRVLQQGAWQFSTAFGSKIASGTDPQIGGRIVICRGPVEFEVHTFRRQPKPAKLAIFEPSRRRAS